MVGLSCSIAQSIAIDLRNRMVYKLVESDQITIGYSKFNPQMSDPNVANDIILKKKIIKIF